MPDRLALDVLAAIDDGIEIRLRRPAVPIPGDDGSLEIILETERFGRRIGWKNRVTRDDLVSGVGSEAIAFALETGAHAIRNAPAPTEESDR